MRLRRKRLKSSSSRLKHGLWQTFGPSNELSSNLGQNLAAANQLKASCPTSAFAETGSASSFARVGPPAAGRRRGRLLLRLIVCLSAVACLPSQPASSGHLEETISVSTKNLGSFRGLLVDEPHDWSGRSQPAPGDSRQKLAAFLGIRYASAPAKRLRFMPPTQYRYAANQIHDATKFGPICPQRWPIPGEELPTSGPTYHNSNLSSVSSSSSSSERTRGHLDLLAKTMPVGSFAYLRPLFVRLMSREQSEDCLNLNIYVRATQVGANQSGQQQQQQQQSLLPVLVIIHGESFDYGSGSAYDAHKLLPANMLVVSLNFRLNIFGFLPKLSGASRGNLGLMDQIAALHWIRDNIGAFGGASENITLMGTKRAAIFANLLMLSPMAKGLFHRAILEDGSALSALTANQVAAPAHQLSQSVQYLRVLAKLCDCPLASGGGGGGGGDGDAKANTQMLDCLRYKPVDQLLARIPLDLLQLDANELIIQPKWQTKVRPYLAANNSSPIKWEHLTQIYSQVIAQARYQSTQDSAASDELFEVIFGHDHSQSARPLFGPLVDGSIVPDEEFAASMLRDDSPLANKDLLLGLTHPVLRHSHAHNRSSSLLESTATPTTTTTTTSTAGWQLDAGNYLSERLLADEERQGLSNEQAVGLVNAFVKSFYRYHQQEIANSILNHYLSSNVYQQPPPPPPTKSMGDEADESAKIRLRRRNFLLGSISRLFQDSLTDVPSFKLALIHSTKQMDSLLQVLADHLFDQWKLDERHLGGEQDNFPPSTAGSDSERKYLLETFTTFARHLLDSRQRAQLDSLPQEWRHLSLGHRTRGTYLYQFESPAPNQLSARIRAAIERIITGDKVIEQQSIWRLVNPILVEIDARLKSSTLSTINSLECNYYPQQMGQDDDTQDELKADRIMARLEDWFCWSSTRDKIVNFVTTGDVNSLDSSIITADSIDWRLAEFERECSPATMVRDHHSVQATIDGNRLSGDRQLSTECRRQLADIVLRALTNELGQKEQKSPALWESFNVFSQQVATFSLGHEIRLNRISEFSSEPTSLMAKSSFWSNFIPALNCNKTQPITPTALLDGAFNSSLLNLNLQFTCQLGGSRTAQGYIESIVASASQRLQSRKNQWRQTRLNSSQQSASSAQNHHSLRMANMSQSNGAEDGVDSPSSSSSIEDHNQSNFSQSFSSLSDSGELSSLSAATLRSSKLTGLVLVLCALVVSMTLVSGTYVALKQHHRRRREAAKQQAQQQQKPPEVELADCRTPVANFISQPAAEDQRQAETVGPVDAAAQIDWPTGNIVALNEEQSVDLIHQSEHEHQAAMHRYGHAALMNQQHFDESIAGIGHCRSHSAMSLASQLHSTADSSFVPIADTYNDLAFEPIVGSHEFNHEPIVLPILSNNHRQHQLRCETLNARRHNHQQDYLANQSSTDTQNGRSSQSSTVGLHTGAMTLTKKRVKISEPQSIMKTPGGHSRNRQTYEDAHQQVVYQQQQQLNKSRVQLCPIHSRSQSNQFLSAANQTYLVNEAQSEYLPLNIPVTWAQQPSPENQFNPNCDHTS